MSTFRFTGQAVGADPTGYTHPRWDQAYRITVFAATLDEATRKALLTLGEHPRWGTRTSSGWDVRWDSIDEVDLQETIDNEALRTVWKELQGDALNASDPPRRAQP